MLFLLFSYLSHFTLYVQPSISVWMLISALVQVEDQSSARIWGATSKNHDGTLRGTMNDRGRRNRNADNGIIWLWCFANILMTSLCLWMPRRRPLDPEGDSARALPERARACPQQRPESKEARILSGIVIRSHSQPLWQDACAGYERH